MLEDRPVKNVGLIIVTGERGLCGAYNSKAIKLAEKRIEYIESTGANARCMFVGNKGY